jgi:SSS family solute:Na+ symporter
MTWIDWTIVLIPAVLIVIIAVVTQRYMRGVADFLAAGRCAGRYLVCNAMGEAGNGAIATVAFFEMFYKYGFAVSWWNSIGTPISILITLSGYIIYRYRETRAMTVAQFFEIRYSRSFRVFMGIVAWVSGLINFGIFPAVGARFFVNFCGLPQQTLFLGHLVPTFALVMAVLLGATLSFTLLGGQLTAMVTDCIEGLISGILFVAVTGALLWLFPWHDISQAMSSVPAGKSLLNPFDTSRITDFNLWYVLIAFFGGVYTIMAWQGNQGFNCSAVSPHEAKMGAVLGRWRRYAREVTVALLAACAFTYMNHPAFASGAAQVNQALGHIGSPYVREQMRVPVALAHLLPVGIKGCFAAIMLFGLVASDGAYMHSWGSIFIQDVVLPLGKWTLTPRQHIRLLRFSIAGVAIFAYCFGLFYNQTQDILFFFALTGTIYLGGAGVVIAGGLYWKKGTTPAAWAGMILGASLGVIGLLLDQKWKSFLAPILLDWFPHNAYLLAHTEKFPINGQWMWFISMVMAIVVYMVISLLTIKKDFNMDRMLHRGQYSVDAEGKPLPPVPKPPRSWRSLLGIDAQFTRGDRALSFSIFWWSMMWFGVFVVITAWNLLRRWPVQWWANYWYIAGILLPFAIGIVTSIWFTIGGLRDLRRLFILLETRRRNPLDDGTVPSPAPAIGDEAVVAETASKVCAPS